MDEIKIGLYWAAKEVAKEIGIELIEETDMHFLHVLELKQILKKEFIRCRGWYTKDQKEWLWEWIN